MAPLTKGRVPVKATVGSNPELSEYNVFVFYSMRINPNLLINEFMSHLQLDPRSPINGSLSCETGEKYN